MIETDLNSVLVSVMAPKLAIFLVSVTAITPPISVKFRTEFDRGEARLLHMFKVKGQRSKVKVTGSEFKVTV